MLCLGVRFIGSTILLLGISTPALTNSFPDKDWSESDLFPKESLLASASCREFLADSFYQEKPDTIRTDAVLVIQDGKMVFEQYNPNPTAHNFAHAGHYVGHYHRDKPHILWSASKSITATIIGAAIQQARADASSAPAQFNLGLDSKLSQYYTEADRNHAYEVSEGKTPKDSKSYREITVKHLLDMGASISWNESYEGDPVASSVIAMLYLHGIDDMATFAIRQPMTEFAPGTLWNYSSGNSSLLMGILRKIYATTNSKAVSEFPWELLFNKMNFHKAAIEQDGAGVYVGSSYVHLRPMDMAKIGYLYLMNGYWGETQLLPNEWVRLTTEIGEPYRSANTIIKNSTGEGVYGMTWWLNRNIAGMPGKPTREVDEYKSKRAGEEVYKTKVMPYPDLDEDFFGAFGHYGQYLFVLPTRKMVIVRTADDRDPHAFDVNKWVFAAQNCFTGRDEQ